MFLLDTNIWIALLKGRNAYLLDRWRSVPAYEIAVCAVVKAELWHGAHKYENPEKRGEIVDGWLELYISHPFDDEAARRYAGLRHHLEQRGEIIGPHDLKIAAICLVHNLTLVTNNLVEFRRVPQLKLADWSVP